MTTTIRLATTDDAPALAPLVAAAIDELQRGFLDDAQIESSKAIMGIDGQLIDDGTYFVVEIDGGFRPVEEVEDASGGAPVPLTRMRKSVTVTPA